MDESNGLIRDLPPLVASRRYFSAESLKLAQMAVIEKEVVPELAAAS